MENNHDRDSKKKMTIEEAANYLAEHKENVAEEIKKEAQKQQIAYTTPTDRAKFLAYGISVLDDIPPKIMKYFPLNVKGGATYLKKDVIGIFKFILTCKINLYTNRYIAKQLNIPKDVVDVLELAAVRSVQSIILKKQLTGVPIVNGGLN